MTAAMSAYRALQKAGRRVADHRTRAPRTVLDEGVDGAGPGTVYYLAPDHDAPSGGVRAIYRHVDLLCAAGISATVVHRRRGFRCTWFDNTTPVISGPSLRVSRNDLLVVPEVFGSMLPTLPRGVRHVVFNQSGHLTWDRAPEAVRHHYLTSPDLLAVMTVSDHAAELLRYAFPRTPVTRVHLSIDPTVFHPETPLRSRRIVYLSRRGSVEAEQALNILRSRRSLNGWEVCALDGLRPDALAAELRNSSIYLTLTHQEGFGLPAAEAMACGAYVIGYHGCGGREFLRSDFSRVVESGDTLALARAVGETLDREEREPGWCARAGARAAAYVAHEYGTEKERDDVTRLVSGLLGQSAHAPFGLSRTGEVTRGSDARRSA